MKFDISIQVKALILLLVFSLNTVVGFACSVGLDMGFNSNHHRSEESTEAIVHIHSDGKKHIHSEKKTDHKTSRHHEQDNDHRKSKEGKNDCCNDQVLKFEQLDKSVSYSLHIIHPTFLIAFFDSFYDVTVSRSDIVKDIKQFVRSYHPPISNVRIAIQSFQI